MEFQLAYNQLAIIVEFDQKSRRLYSAILDQTRYDFRGAITIGRDGDDDYLLTFLFLKCK